MNKTDFNFVKPEDRVNNEQIRPGLTYWKDAWRRLK
ncbi:MAG: diguanylate cyclase, partial [Tenericutes bacterium HGW-Tenericutes-3]